MVEGVVRVWFRCLLLVERSTFRHISRGVTERRVFAFACQCTVSLGGRTGNRTVAQMRHPLLVEGRPNCARQSLASKLSAPRVAATSHCDPGRHANVVTPCLLTPCLNMPKTWESQPNSTWKPSHARHILQRCEVVCFLADSHIWCLLS